MVMTVTMSPALFFRISFFVEAVDQPEKEEERRSAIAVVELQVSVFESAM
jgi:hypothetical protein